MLYLPDMKSMALSLLVMSVLSLIAVWETHRCCSPLCTLVHSRQAELDNGYTLFLLLFLFILQMLWYQAALTTVALAYVESPSPVFNALKEFRTLCFSGPLSLSAQNSIALCCSQITLLVTN